MRRFARTTRGRLAAVAVAILGLALLVADGAVLGSLALTGRSESDAVLVGQANLIAASIEESNGALSFGSTDPPLETSAGIVVDASIVSPSQTISQSAVQPLSTSTLTELAARADRSGPVWADVSSTKGTPRRAYAIPLMVNGRQSAALVVSRSVRELQASLARTLLLLAIVSVGMLIVGGLLSYWLAGRVLRPVSIIAGLARSLSEDDLHLRVDLIVPEDELGELVATFNGMLGRLEGAFVSLRRFTADASHELRAPLALMLSQLEGSLQKARTKDEYRRVLEAQKNDVEHLSRLVDQLLILARADAGALRPASELVDVPDLLHETEARWYSAADQKGCHLSVSAPDWGQLRGDPALLRRVLDNLVDNALRYAPQGTGVRLLASRVEGAWNIDVADEGPGVPREYRSHLFERFARPDGARTPDDGGAGLGLALSAAVARAHGGDLSLLDEDTGGAVFQLHLPDRAGGKRPAVRNAPAFGDEAGEPPAGAPPP